MEILLKRNEKELTISLIGELNSLTALELDKVIGSSLNDVTSLIFDLEKLTYLSSAGLRVLLIAQKIMLKQGKMLIKNVSNEVYDIFDITGFTTILEIER